MRIRAVWKETFFRMILWQIMNKKVCSNCYCSNKKEQTVDLVYLVDKTCRSVRDCRRCHGHHHLGSALTADSSSFSSAAAAAAAASPHHMAFQTSSKRVYTLHAFEISRKGEPHAITSFVLLCIYIQAICKCRSSLLSLSVLNVTFCCIILQCQWR